MKKKILILFLVGLLAGLIAAPPAVRVKDVAKVKGARDNQLLGFGLVVGLKNTGDSAQSTFTQRALTNLLKKMGISAEDEQFKSRNIAGVMVTTDLPPFARKGQRVDVQVSAIGDCASLRGGTLLLTPLQGADGDTYVVAQGPLFLSETNDPLTKKPKTETVGQLLGGGIVEKEVPYKLAEKEAIQLVLNDRDFTTAYRIAYSLQRGGIAGVKALDAGTVEIQISPEDKDNIVPFISRLEDFLVVPDSLAKVVVSQKTGTVVIGENVKLAPVAVAHGEIEIVIKADEQNTGQENPFAATETTAVENPDATTETPKTVPGADKKLIELKGGTSLKALVKALNSVGTSPKDVIAILYLLKRSGALTAEIEVI
jgi:flagellar P-ring protein FlgI